MYYEVKIKIRDEIERSKIVTREKLESQYPYLKDVNFDQLTLVEGYTILRVLKLD